MKQADNGDSSDSN